MNKKKFSVIDIFIAILLFTMLFSAYKLYGNYVQAQESKKQFADLEDILNIPDGEDDKIYYLTAQQRYQSVYDSNNHFVAWLEIEDTPLNYPIVHTPNSPEYYLRRDFSGKYSQYGVPFMDYRNTPDSDRNTIVYGHNMKNGTMFSAVEKYTDKNYWQQHPYINFDTMNGYGVYEVICVYRIDVANSEFYFNQWLDFNNEAEFNSYISQSKAMSPYDTGVSAAYGDTLLTLSTCEYTYEDGRCVLLAKKIDSPAVKAYDSEGNVIKGADIPQEYLN